jgi:hypothetical protein
MQLICWDMAFLGWVASPFWCFLLWKFSLGAPFLGVFCSGFLIKHTSG